MIVNTKDGRALAALEKALDALRKGDTATATSAIEGVVRELKKSA